MPLISSQNVKTIHILFQQIQNTFNNLFPNKNFFTNNYVLYKLCQLLKLKKVIAHIPLRNFNTMKLANNDKSWEKICAELNWPLIKS